MRPLILYHADCADGFCAAWVAWRKFGDNADYQAVQYGQPPPDVTGRSVYLLDFSYKADVLSGMIAVASEVTVLDHHKTAQADLEVIREHHARHGDPVLIVFDMKKSGGRLAWDHFFGDEYAAKYENADSLRPWLVDYTEDRDLWRWALPFSRAVSAWLTTIPRTFAAWQEVHEASAGVSSDSWIEQGEAILCYQAQLVEQHAKNAVGIVLDGHEVLAVNATCLISEIGERLAQDRAFGATYFIRADGKRVWSLRSRPPFGVDVSEIAKRHGGGGHRNAAGFTE